MKKLSILILLASCWAFPFSIPLTVHEMLIYTDSLAATARTAGPVTVGLPLADSMAIIAVDQLGLSGTPLGQFRVLQRWPSGNIKWVLCDFQADCGSRQKNISIALTSGSGTFGGPDLAALTDSSININTGPAQFRVRLHRFNLIDYASVGGRELVSPGKSRGIVLKGAFGGDPRLFMSSLDSLDTVKIEENGPVRACIYAHGVHRAPDGTRHFNYIVRMNFHKGSSDIDFCYSLANASRYEPSNGFMHWVHLEVALNLAGSKGYKVSAHDGELTGNVTGAGVALYQGRSGYPVNPYDFIGPTPDTGYTIASNGSVIKRGALSQYAMRFYGDLSGSDGYGMTGAIEYAAGWFPKSIDLDSAGVVSLGVFPRENSQGFYKVNFGTHNTSRLLLSFHGAGQDPNLATACFQYPLVAKAPTDWYNQSNALYEKMVQFPQEDSFFTALFGRTYDPIDKPAPGAWNMDQSSLSTTIYRMYYTGDGGGNNQHCSSRQGLYNFLREDRITWAGTFYNYALQRIRYMNDWAMFRADDFKVNHNEIPQLFDTPGNGYTWIGYIWQNDTNGVSCPKCNYDGEHKHWYGSSLLYQMTGDNRDLEAIKSFGNYEINMDLARWRGWDRGGSMHIRALSELLDITGDSAYYDSLVHYIHYDMLSTDAHPSPNPNTPGAGASWGMWWDRGAYLAYTEAQDSVKGWMAYPLLLKNIRFNALARAYSVTAMNDPLKDDLRDLLNGLGHFIEKELWYNFAPSAAGLSDQGCVGYPYAYSLLRRPDTTRKNINGYPEPFFLIEDNGDTSRFSPSFREDFNVQTVNNQLWDDTMATGSWFYWESRLFERPPGWGGMYWYKYYPGMMYSIHQRIHPERNYIWRTFDVTAQNLGNGSWKLSWTVPQGATSYQIKYSDKSIVEWLNFNQYTRQYEFDPAQYVAFYHAKNINDEPAPAAAGTAQEMTVTGLTAGTTYHFSAKFYNGPDGANPTGVETGSGSAGGLSGVEVYPNPANPSVAIRFSLAGTQKIEATIFNLQGRVLKTICNDNLGKGRHTLTWNGRDKNSIPVASGVYFLNVKGEKQTINRKIVLLK